MTPLAMEMLIWFHTRSVFAGPFPNIGRGPQQEIVAWFLSEGIIEEAPGYRDTYAATPKGSEWLAAALQTPMPDDSPLRPLEDVILNVTPADTPLLDKLTPKPSPATP